MKIATISHSHVARRQQLFFEEVARQGHNVLMIGPGEWGTQKAQSYNIHWDAGVIVPGYFQFSPCRHMGTNVYDYHLLGAKDLVDQFKPDILYLQAEPGSQVAQEVSMWNDVPMRVIFTWENIKFEPIATQTLGSYDLVICGNPEAVELVKPWNGNTVLMLQVGVDIAHFQARPDVARDINVGYIGRQTPEKGLPYLSQAWPTVRLLPWTDFLQLPWFYSQIKVIVAYSQDMPWWREQAPNYVVLEALSCGCKAVTSDTAAMKYWLEGCPGVVMINGHEQPDDALRLERVERLRNGIQVALQGEIKDEGRDWVVERFSNPIMAKKLLEVLEDA